MGLRFIGIFRFVGLVGLLRLIWGCWLLIRRNFRFVRRRNFIIGLT